MLAGVEDRWNRLWIVSTGGLGNSGAECSNPARKEDTLSGKVTVSDYGEHSLIGCDIVYCAVFVDVSD
jgi:hypothetical protein